jgi:serine/threonine protein kinase
MKTPEIFAESLGLEVIETIAHRRGSFVLKVRRNGEILALKGCDPSVEDTYDRGELVQREAVILQELGESSGKQYSNWGEDAIYGSWLLLRWIDGETASAAGVRIRTLDKNRICSELPPLFISIAEAYAKVHRIGFLHGDVQPQHVLFEKDSHRVILLDWGLAQRVGGDNLPYKGGFVHFAAPEIAQGMLEERKAIEYSVSAEIYSLGALFRFVYTGETATDYGSRDMAQVPFRKKLEAVAGNCLRVFPDPTNEGEARLQAIIKRCLDANPTSRFESADALLQALSLAAG